MNSNSTLRICAALVVMGVGVTSGCKKTTAPAASPNTGQPPAPKGVPVASAPEALQGAIKQADGAFMALKSTLGSRLKAAISEGGPVSAIGVCQEEAASLARKVEKESRLSVGRTSQRLRNPANASPWWAEDTVLSGAASDGLAFDLGASVGVLRPIRLEAVCTTCHGKQLDPTLAAELARRYPADQATGFAEGDLRGYFWADVPKT